MTLSIRGRVSRKLWPRPSHHDVRQPGRCGAWEAWCASTWSGSGKGSAHPQAPPRLCHPVPGLLLPQPYHALEQQFARGQLLLGFQVPKQGFFHFFWRSIRFFKALVPRQGFCFFFWQGFCHSCKGASSSEPPSKSQGKPPATTSSPSQLRR